MARERHFLFPFFCPMVCHRKTKAGSGPDRVLVAEPLRIHHSPLLRAFLPKRLGIHFCVRFYLDSLYPQFSNPTTARASPSGLSRLRKRVPATFKLLPCLRRGADARRQTSGDPVDHFLGALDPALGAGAVPEAGFRPYLTAIGSKSLCVVLYTDNLRMNSSVAAAWFF